jgi:hypothetical protein
MDIGCWVFDIGHWVMPTEARLGGRRAGVGSIQTFFRGNDYRPFPGSGRWKVDDGRWRVDDGRRWQVACGVRSGWKGKGR